MSDVVPTERIDIVGRRPLAWWPVGLIAAGATLLLLITANRYDYHRDELYFRMLGQHPQWGYVDQPPFTPLLARLGIEFFGDTVWGMRVPFALVLGLTALVAAVIAREVGGGAVAQSIAAAGVVSAFPLSAAHVSSTAAVDLLVWLGVVFFVIRALQGSSQGWVWAGVTAGAGLYNKHLVVLLLVSLAVGLLVAGPRPVFRSRMLWMGVAAVVVVGLPNVVYQVVHGFPQVQMTSVIAVSGAERLMVVPLQFVLIVLPPVWIAGIVMLARDRRLRSIAVAYPVLLILVLVSGGQAYYPVGLLLALFAVGAVPTTRWMTRRWRQVFLWTGVAVSALVAVVSGLPAIPEEDLGDSFVVAVNQTVADQIGWREYVWQVGAVYAGLSDADQRKTVLFAGNYGEAGALDRYGPSLALPDVYSGHNSLFDLGPPPKGKSVVVAVVETAPRELGNCAVKARLHNSVGVENEELSSQVYVCRLSQPWSSVWPGLKHYG
ncbi:hypothetical protein FB565_002269 [Actinoplanes lutulentus]|uniref:ArnT family glycosyltransferase n=1 Tax=Actinoplanes lutulentus TaxID=1287878 RepID=UPI00179D7200|nr:glycosyltransferase family 39 protein [Actinoplanes lutulentus]MBB2942556.1 hypothetical protein [Actinoplanes lutulentus]